MWRKRSEAACPDLAGDDPYVDQVPLSRAIPLWGGVSAGGFAEVLIHETKKLNGTEWAEAVDSGRLRDAIKSLRPIEPNGPWKAISDNERFLRTALAGAAHRRAGVKLWRIPAKSPDLNPAEKYWSWLRWKLRALDLADALKKRPVLSKMAYKARVRSVCRSKRSQAVASACAIGLKKVCKEVIKKKGAATRG